MTLKIINKILSRILRQIITRSETDLIKYVYEKAICSIIGNVKSSQLHMLHYAESE